MGSVGDCIDFFGDEGLGNKDCPWNFGLLLVTDVNGDKRHERINPVVCKMELVRL